MYETLLVPLDGSKLAEVAMPYAEELAARLGSVVTLLHVCGSTDAPFRHVHGAYMRTMVEAARRGGKKYFEAPAAEPVQARSAILTGDAAEKIVAYADKENIGLIILATHGRSGIGRWVLGSVADKVVRATSRPVMIVRAKDGRPGVRGKDRIDGLVVPMDGSKAGEAVLPYVIELSTRLKAKVTLFEATPRAFRTYGASGEGVGQVPFTDEEMKPLVTAARNYLQKVAERLHAKGVTTSEVVRVGEAADEIIKLADEIKTDLVAMTTHGHSGVGRWVFGSVADKVLHAGNTPLMLVRVKALHTT